MTIQISRRTMLRGAGALIGLPFLDIMRPVRANAASHSMTGRPALPHRVAFFYAPNGMHMPAWTPQETGASFALPPTMEPLRDLREKVNVLSGLGLDGARAHGDGPGDHARAVASWLTGAHPVKTSGAGIRNGTSIDQMLAELTSAGTMRLPTLEAGMEGSTPAGDCDSGYSCVYTSNLSWRNPTTPVAKEIDPAALFDRVFGINLASADAAGLERLRASRKSILDAALDQAESLHRRLGHDDRRKLDEYLYSVRDVERRLGSTEKLDKPEHDPSDFPRPAGVPEKYSEHMNLLFDVMAIAWQIDATRIMTFMMGNAGSNRNYREIEISDGHHDLSHHGNNKDKQARVAKINLFHMELFAGFLKRLDSITEGNGTLLDNSLIVYGSGIADGNSHSHMELPILTAGSGGGHYRTGEHFRFERETPLTNLYQTVLHVAGAGDKKIGDANGILDSLIND